MESRKQTNLAGGISDFPTSGPNLPRRKYSRRSKPGQDDPGPYWVIWNQEHGLPTQKHRSYFEALKESRRLAKLHPGKKFRILKSVSTITISKELDIS